MTTRRPLLRSSFRVLALARVIDSPIQKLEQHAACSNLYQTAPVDLR